MEVRFLCLQEGRRYYDVVLHGQAIFTGTFLECGRFMEIHNEKVAEEIRVARKKDSGASHHGRRDEE